MKAQAYAEITQARADLEATRTRAERYRDNILDQARKAADGAEFAYQNGALGVTDLLDARRTFKATSLESEVAQANYAKALAFWETAVKGYTEDENNISR